MDHNGEEEEEEDDIKFCYPNSSKKGNGHDDKRKKKNQNIPPHHCNSSHRRRRRRSDNIHHNQVEYSDDDDDDEEILIPLPDAGKQMLKRPRTACSNDEEEGEVSSSNKRRRTIAGKKSEHFDTLNKLMTSRRTTYTVKDQKRLFDLYKSKTQLDVSMMTAPMFREVRAAHDRLLLIHMMGTLGGSYCNWMSSIDANINLSDRTDIPGIIPLPTSNVTTKLIETYRASLKTFRIDDGATTTTRDKEE